MNSVKTAAINGLIFSTLSLSISVYAQSNFQKFYKPKPQETSSEGAVYAMTNDFETNSIVSYGRNDDGTLELINTVLTGGKGAAFDGGEGLDPLISAYSLIITDDREHVIAVNAGSNTVSVFKVNDDFSLRLTDVQQVYGVGPNSVAYHNGLVYVSSIDADGQFAGEPDQEGNLTGFRINERGRLRPIRNSVRLLENRPSAVQFSPDGRFLVVSSINAGSVSLNSGSNDEIVVYEVRRGGRLSRNPVSAAASTDVNNPDNRNLASAIGFEIVQENGKQYIVVTEAREFQADGTPPAFAALQTGSVSTWELGRFGELTPVAIDVITGTGQFDGERTACWIEFSHDESVFWVSNALESTISTYSFEDGKTELLNRTAAAGTGPAEGDPFGTTDGWVDLWLSDDGDYLYQLFGLSGSIGVYKVGENGALDFVQTVSDLPQQNTQGIVAF